jgi:hypothetical protein
VFGTECAQAVNSVTFLPVIRNCSRIIDGLGRGRPHQPLQTIKNPAPRGGVLQIGLGEKFIARVDAGPRKRRFFDEAVTHGIVIIREGWLSGMTPSTDAPRG